MLKASFKSVIFLAAVSLALYSCDKSDFNSTTKQNSSGSPGSDAKPDTPGDPGFTGTGDPQSSPTPSPKPGDLNENGGAACNGKAAGLAGKVYKLTKPASLADRNAIRLPDFSTLTPLGFVTSSQLDIPRTEWTTGFPGRPDLTEWFGIVFEGEVNVTADTVVTFRLTSDDGSKLYFGQPQTLIINNDGLIDSVSKDSSAVTLKAGANPIKVEWFQGTPTHIRLELFWRLPGQTTFALVPSSALTHSVPCKLPDFGTF